MAVVVDGLELATAVDFGLFWERLSADYPRVEQYPRVLNEIEDLSSPPQGATIRFQVAQLLPTNSLWFVTEEGAEAVEIQSDRIGWHWRRPTERETYPRYPHVRSHFDATFEVIASEVQKRLGDRPSPVQCEVKYINEIPAQPSPSGHGDPDPILRLWSPAGGHLPGPAEDVRLTARYRLPSDPRSLGGRLIVTLEPAQRVSDNKPIYVLSLVAKGKAAELDRSATLEFMDFGREVIVESFTKITTTAKHDEWGRES